MGWLTPLAELLLRCNCSVLLYDYEGYGDSGGSPSLRRLVDDGMCAYDYMSKNLAGDQKIILFGVSMGTGVSCQIASKKTKQTGLFCHHRSIAAKRGTTERTVFQVRSKCDTSQAASRQRGSAEKNAPSSSYLARNE